ncbi:MAG: type IV secretory system conjugative DNA transfer family protein [Pseudomonadota bacterium]
MTNKEHQNGARLLPGVFLSAGLFWACGQFGPIVKGGAIDPYAALLVFSAGVIGLATLADGFQLLGDMVEGAAARKPKGLKGMAAWAKWREIKRELSMRYWAPFWGMTPGRKALLASYESNAMTIGPAGSSKSASSVIPTILSIRGSKFICDFKGELAACLKARLEKRGEIVRIINLGDVFTDLLGPSDAYNPLVVIADDCCRPGGLRDVVDDVRQLCLRLYPEPVRAGGDADTYWRDGSRSFLRIAILLCVLVKGHKASLGDVLQLINDREQFERDCAWAAGKLVVEGSDAPIAMPIEDCPWIDQHESGDVVSFIAYVRGAAASALSLLAQSDSKAAESFLSGAQLAIDAYNLAGRVHARVNETSFRFADLKEGDRPTTVFLIADPDRKDAQMGPLALLQWCAQTEVRRHPNKHRRVHFIIDEATNFRVFELPSLLTWGRSSGIRLHLIFQTLAAFEETYGRNAVDTLISETEIKQFLAGQRDPRTIQLMMRLMGEQSVIAKSHNARSGQMGLESSSATETGRPLMTEDEIRRTDKSILFIRRQRPILTLTPPYAAIAPFRSQVASNPYHEGKKWKLPVRLRVKRRVRKEPRKKGQS